MTTHSKALTPPPEIDSAMVELRVWTEAVGQVSMFVRHVCETYGYDRWYPTEWLLVEFCRSHGMVSDSGTPAGCPAWIEIHRAALCMLAEQRGELFRKFKEDWMVVRFAKPGGWTPPPPMGTKSTADTAVAQGSAEVSRDG